MASTRHHRKRSIQRWAKTTAGILAIYLLVCYIVIPQLDTWRFARHPDLAAGEHLTRTGIGIPGDPLNLALVGSEAEVTRALLAAHWVPANALGVRSSVRIAVDTLFDKPDPNAPVSNLYLFGRREDLAFEKPIGHNPRERHHVRLWRSAQLDNGRAVWLGAATHDLGVELSRTTGQVTHHIAADVDAERDLLVAELTQAGQVPATRWIAGFHQPPQGRNGGGDPWHTDGRLPVLTLLSATP